MEYVNSSIASDVMANMAAKPYYLHLELTNQCNADCIFCGYRNQKRPLQIMSDDVFDKALSDFLSEGGGSVTLTPIVGDALIDPNFLNRVERIRSFDSIDRIRLITNGILLDRFGIENIVKSGISFLAISTSGLNFQEYERIYRSRQYTRMFRNVMSLLECNQSAGNPIQISILIRSDRNYEDVVQDADFKKIIQFEPGVHYTNTFSTFGGRLDSSSFVGSMTAYQEKPDKPEPCQRLFDSPIILPDGTVLACDCYSAMDAIDDLQIGNIKGAALGDIWRSQRMQEIRNSFMQRNLNQTCAQCDNYECLNLYRSEEGKIRAELNRLRLRGIKVKRPSEKGFWINP
jgi:radical SAM protein with 4Fe4S-binding SPASM domain